MIINCQVLIKKLTSNKEQHLIVENELKKLETCDSIYFRDKNHFEDDSTHNYFVFQPIQRYSKRVDGVANDNYKNYVFYWKSKELSDEKN